MEGIPEKDMEERRRVLEQKTQGKQRSVGEPSVSHHLIITSKIEQGVMPFHYYSFIIGKGRSRRL